MKKEVKENKKEKKTAKASAAPVVEKETEVVVDDKTLDNDGRVGTMLKDTRLKKGEELENIAKTLRIRTTFLEAIENSSYDELPPAPYGQGLSGHMLIIWGLIRFVFPSCIVKKPMPTIRKKTFMFWSPRQKRQSRTVSILCSACWRLFLSMSAGFIIPARRRI